ncbi:uncharacterized protein LOC120023350 [Salvelinus namaycush]|uniref:Uncharacterized protein LOC120023350 n=2 Tax=Salvelinus namaycush TaxID=8040 RepID=A0A8U0PDT8_SALNM|nr:uncharacterized protein LOC120023350 [Salvelinus namaycush]
MYVVLDEQSNKSLAKTEFFNLFNINDNSAPYTMKTCSGVTETSGRRAVNFMVESIDGHMQLSLPTLIECDMMPDDRTEIPSPDIAYHHPHLQPVMDKIPAVDPDAPILLLLGRDILRVHKVREQINGPHDTPYAQRLDLGWVIVAVEMYELIRDEMDIDVNAAKFYTDKPHTDAEIRPDVTVFASKVSGAQLGSHRFERFSSWKALNRATARLIHVARSFHEGADNTSCRGWHDCNKPCGTSELSQAKTAIIHCVQHEAFREEFKCLEKGKEFPKQSTLKKLNPVIDEDGLLRVGGRLSSADMSQDEKHPLIIPRTHHVATLLVRHYHEQVAHQGRHFSDGAIRAAGFWIIGSKRLVSGIIHKCVTCRKVRGRLVDQKMADLPADRLSSEPPFTSVGLDVFGPWNVITRRTRGGSADSKRWAVLFTCMSTRAVHIELIESMSTSSFINALRRFFSIRGPAKVLRSDRGTNFIGACRELGIDTNDSELTKYLSDKGCTWIFNPPHSSHMGGSWERLIGVARRILDAMLFQTGSTRLTHEVLSTLMSEVMAIINARPLVSVSTDPDMPAILTPSMLLTQKTSATSAPSGYFSMNDLHGKQWKQVQCLADTFWKRWRQEYLTTLQRRRKWTAEKPNVKVGDVVLLKDSQAHRNDWPVGLVVKTFPSTDKKVRKVELKIVKQGAAKVFLRPISEIVVLLSEAS